MSGHDPIDSLARRAAAALEDATRPRVARPPDPDELRAVHGRRRMRQRAAVGVAVAAALAVFVGAGRGLLPDTLELWIDDVVGGPAQTPEATPSGDASDAFDQPGSWTVETPVGAWSWAWVPASHGAQDLYAQALGERTDSDSLEGASVEQVPVPEIAGMRWGVGQLVGHGSHIARLDDVTVVVGSIGGELDVDWEALYDAPEDIAFDWRRGASGRELALWDAAVETPGFEPPPPFAVLTVSVAPNDPSAVVFHDQDTGEEVLQMPVTDPAVSAQQVAAGVGFPWDFVSVWYLLVDDGDGFRAIEPPWQHLAIDMVGVAAGRDGLIAVSVGATDWATGDRSPILYRWASPDGIDWQSLGPALVIPLNGPIDRRLHLVGDGNRLLMSLDDDHDRRSLWTSTDGVDWEQVGPALGVWGTAPRPTEFGWALTDMPGDTCRVWVSPDGLAWDQVPFWGEIEHRRGMWAPNCGLLNDKVYVQVEPASGPPPTGLWIGQFHE